MNEQQDDARREVEDLWWTRDSIEALLRDRPDGEKIRIGVLRNLLKTTAPETTTTHPRVMTAEQQGSDESGEGLSEAEREALLRAWPWPSESATTEGGFGAVESAVQCIISAREFTSRGDRQLAETGRSVASSAAQGEGEVGARVLREAAEALNTEDAATDVALLGVDYVIQRLLDRADSLTTDTPEASK